MHDIPQPTNPKQIDRETRETDRDKFVRMLKYAKFPQFAAFADSSRLRIRFAQNIVRGERMSVLQKLGEKAFPKTDLKRPSFATVNSRRYYSDPWDQFCCF